MTENLTIEQHAMITLITAHWEFLNSPTGQQRVIVQGKRFNDWPDSPRYLKMCLHRGIGHSRVADCLHLAVMPARVQIFGVSEFRNFEILLAQIPTSQAEICVFDAWHSFWFRRLTINRYTKLLAALDASGFRMVVFLG